LPKLFGNKKVIANSGPIISFARADYLDLLEETVKEIIIPNAVFGISRGIIFSQKLKKREEV
jgi:predicted nucleic acid-binding protein